MKTAYIGAMGWSYKQWNGKLYPQELKPSEYLREYSKYFNSVELNNTFYRIPRIKTVENWRNQTPDGFKFAAKFPRSISHSKTIGGDKEKLDVFLRNIGYLQEKLGPLLLQLSPNLQEKREELEAFLAKLPNQHRYAVEFRHKTWFIPEIYEVLRRYKVALVIVDPPWLPVPEEITADFTYIRWQGDRKKVTGDSGVVELDRKDITIDWGRRIRKMLESVDVYGYFSKHYSGYPPQDIEDLMSSA